VPVCVEALKAAVHEAKQGTDIGRYKEAWECIRIAAPNEPEAVLDQRWIDRVDLQNTTELQRLEGELKGYRNNLIKESIRVSNCCTGQVPRERKQMVGTGY
jgi:COP9 signalosome complex subunit 1